MKDKIMKRHSIGEYWGRFALAGSQIAVFVSTFTLLMVCVSAYVPISTWLVERKIYLSFMVFMAIILGFVAIGYFLSWKFLVASFYRSSTEQFWSQNNPLIQEIKDIKEMLGNKLPKIEERLKKLEKERSGE